MAHTHEDHEAYLETVRARLVEVNDLIDAAPCGLTLVTAIEMLTALSDACQRDFSNAYGQAIQNQTRRLYGLN